MKYKIGDRVEIYKMKFPIFANLVGLTGKIEKIRTEPFNDYEKQTGEIQSYLIRADNYGHLMSMPHGKKKVYAWKPNDITNRFSSELKLI